VVSKTLGEALGLTVESLLALSDEELERQLKAAENGEIATTFRTLEEFSAWLADRTTATNDKERR